MTGLRLSGGIVSASTTYETNTPGKAFDGLVNTCWGNNDALPAWLRYQHTEAVELAAWSVMCDTTDPSWADTQYFPTAIQLRGSNNGTDWDVLDTQTVSLVAGVAQEFSLSDPGDYTYYDLYITDNEGATNWVCVYEFGLYSNRYVVRSTFHQVYNLIGDVKRAACDQLYHLTAQQRAVLEQIYSMRMLQVFHMLYGDADKYRQTFDMRYWQATPLRKIFDMEYGRAPRFRQTYDQEYHLLEGMRQIFQVRYGLTDSKVRAMADFQYDLLDREFVRQQLDQIWVLAAGEALVQKIDITVTVDGKQHHGMENIFEEQDESLYYLVAELQYPAGKIEVDGRRYSTEEEYLDFAAWDTEVEINIKGDIAYYVPEIPRIRRSTSGDTFIVPLVSPTILLDAPHNRQTAEAYQGMASGLVAELAAPFTVDWQLDVDWYIRAGILTSTGESGISIIKKIVAAAGGLVQTGPDSTLICRKEYPVSVPDWETTEPDYELTDQDDFFEIDSNPAPRNLYNIFLVSDQEQTGDGVSIEITEISDREVEVRVFMVPFTGDYNCELKHSGGSWVDIIADGIVEEEYEEQIEIIGGSGTTSKPFYEKVSEGYSQTDLGETEITEEGAVTTEEPDNSLYDLAYKSKCWRFTAYDDEIENVQFFPDITTIAEAAA